VYEALVVCVVAALVFVGIHRYFEPTIRAAQEVALRTGLSAMRSAVKLYEIHEHHTPPDIQTLLGRGYLQPTAQGSVFVPAYLLNQALDADGFPVDPFGNRFLYDPATGRVHSQTPGYGTW
jgi:hypothetical protein